MPDENLKTISNPDPDNWELFQSLFLEKQPSAPSPSPSLDNWSVLESIFGLANGRPSESTNPSASSSSPTGNVTSGSTNPSALTSTSQENTTSESQKPSDFKSAVDNPTQSTSTNSAELIPESARSDTSSNPSRATNRNPLGSTANPASTTLELIQQMAETAKITAQQAAEAARNAQQFAEVAKKQAEIAQAKAEAALEKMSLATETNLPGQRIHREAWIDFLTKHKFKFLFDTIALIQLLFLLHKLFGLKPSLSPTSIYINPITGEDTNNGTVAAPFQTLTLAISQAKAESKIKLAAEDYKIEN